MPSHPRARRAVAALAIVIVVGGVATGVALANSNGASYRTALVQRGTVAQSVTTTGTLSPVDAANLDFQVAGTVGVVRTAVGRKVVAGQTLARLNRSTLRTDLTAAKSTLANAQQQLSDDQSGQTSSATSSASATGTGTGTATNPGTTAATTAFTRVKTAPSSEPSTGSGQGKGGTGSSGSASAVARDQAAIRTAQHATDVDLAAAKTALATANTACASELASSPATGTTTGSATTGLTCAEATAGLQQDQTKVDADETAVNNAELALSADLATAAAAASSTQTTPSSSPLSSSSGSTAQGSRTGSTSSQATAATTVTATAATIASDQANIDTAIAAVATARASLHQAVLVAPISGTVKAVTISSGDSVSGSSSPANPAIQIVGSTQTKATVYVSDTQVRKLQVGMHATVLPDGASHSVPGRVVAIGLVGTESDSGSVTYPVTINVSGSATSLVSGADAAVTVALASAADVLAVPTSAVHYSATTAYVTVLANGKPARRTVKVGAVGAALTEVRSGVTVGNRVVLANLNAAVPSSSTTLTRGSTSGGLGGGFSGGTSGFGGGSGGTGGPPGAP